MKIFPKGFVDGFGQNSKFFHVSISSKIVVQNVSCDILERKKIIF